MRGFAFVLLAVCACLAGCEDRGDAVVSAPAPEPVSFQADIVPIFESSCALASCHVEGVPAGGMILESGRAYSHTVDVPSPTYAGWIRVQPGDPSASLLLRKLLTTGQEGIGPRMPAVGAVSEDQIESIRRWIAEGAAH